MDTWIVTGGAGFIGSQLRAPRAGARPTRASSCVDKLTYAGNLESLADVADASALPLRAGRHRRPRRGRPDRPRAPARGDPQLRRRDARRPLDRRPRRLHPDQRLRRLRAARRRAPPRRAARRRLAPALPLPARLDRRGLRLARPDRRLPARPRPTTRTRRTRPRRRRPITWCAPSRRTYGLPTLLTNCSNNYGPYQYPGEADPADDPERAGGEAAADLRRRRQRARLAARGGPLRGDPDGAGTRAARASATTWAAGRSAPTSRSSTGSAPSSSRSGRPRRTRR